MKSKDGATLLSTATTWYVAGSDELLEPTFVPATAASEPSDPDINRPEGAVHYRRVQNVLSSTSYLVTSPQPHLGHGLPSS